MIDKIISSVNEFFSSATFNPKVFVYNTKEETYYNEANLQHELALYLKQKFQDIIELRLEYPVNKLLKIGKTKLSKKEIDIIIKFKNEEQKANEFLIIELKFPKYNAGMPKTLLNALNDIQFCEQIKELSNDLNIKLHLVTIFLTDKTKWTKAEHIYKVFKLGKDITQVQFTLPKKIEFRNSIDTLRIRVEEIKNRISPSNGNLDPENWVAEDEIRLKYEHEIKWKRINSKWLYYICKF